MQSKINEEKQVKAEQTFPVLVRFKGASNAHPSTIGTIVLFYSKRSGIAVWASAEHQCLGLGWESDTGDVYEDPEWEVFNGSITLQN